MGEKQPSFLVRKPFGPGYIDVIEPGFAGLRQLSLGVLTLREGTQYASETGDREAGLVVLGGRCRVEVGDAAFPEVGDRSDVFSGKAHAVYMPPRTGFSVMALTDMQAALCWCRADARGVGSPGAPAVIGPPAVRVKAVGRDNWSRTVYDIFHENVNAQYLVLGETMNPPGNWSSAPPHKHDVHNPPAEVAMEEIYLFKLKPAQGFGIQRMYDGETFDMAYTLKDGDAVAIPRGYHPVVAGPGYRLYYLWFLAGRGRELYPRTDPDHAWLLRED
ncbi:MAG: 5-deoxy-glucuronate isomerase [Verrucomicrobia bacterium]|nr:5-deoxy-glucuronate isomerase [Verrucomicrobiota bacterium]